MRLLSEHKIAALQVAYRSGMSRRKAARAVGCAENTAQRWFEIFRVGACRCGKLHAQTEYCAVSSTRQNRLKAERPPCECGRPADHRGWCKFRVARSPARQAFLARWGRRAAAQVPALVLVKKKAPVAGYSMFEGKDAVIAARAFRQRQGRPLWAE